MRKIGLIVVSILVALPVFAQLEQGQHLVNVRGGIGFQLQNSGITYSSTDARADWGTGGTEIGLSYHYLLTDRLGLGADFSFGDFEGANLTFSSSNQLEDSVHLVNLMLSARYTANPADRIRFYIPLGAGATIARQSLDIHYFGNSYTNKKTNTSLGLFIGAGLEFDVGHSGWSWGVEARYNTFWYDTDKITRQAPAPIHGDGNRRYEYLTFNINISKRF
ncbi:porin family protein [Candidatus Avelusimicrobium luingense]|uniref:porin family protein n=1 Tax=Candidatus Avelusimicrobium luingense TaxID=3416211 RepID=UPI003D131064